MTDFSTMNQKALRAACKADGISGYGSLSVAAMREALTTLHTVTADDDTAHREMMAKTTEPTRKAHTPRTVLIEKGATINRHYNDDGSITLYARGVKVLRTASEQQIEDGEVSEDYDAEAVVEQFLARWFGKSPRKFGKTTHGHQWKARRAAKTDAPQAQA